MGAERPRNDSASRWRGGEGSAKECEKKRQAEPVSFSISNGGLGGTAPVTERRRRGARSQNFFFPT